MTLSCNVNIPRNTTEKRGPRAGERGGGGGGAAQGQPYGPERGGHRRHVILRPAKGNVLRLLFC